METLIESRFQTINRFDIYRTFSKNKQETQNRVPPPPRERETDRESQKASKRDVHMNTDRLISLKFLSFSVIKVGRNTVQNALNICTSSAILSQFAVHLTNLII